MANKQIHELPAAATVHAADQIVLSTGAGNLTRKAQVADLAVKNDWPLSTERRVAASLSDRVSVKDFGAVGDGLIDDSDAFNSALSSGAGEVFVPVGTYRVLRKINVPGNIRLIGAGYGTAIILSGHNGPIIDVSEGEYVNSSITDLGIDMRNSASVGIQVTGHRVILDRIWFRHGSPTAWAIDMIDANECVLSHVMAGISGPDKFTANGIRWRNSDPANNFVNYGDSLIIAPVIRLESPNTTAMLFDGGQNGNLVNNVTIDRAQINAPRSGSRHFAGTVGIYLKNAARFRIMGCGFEAIEVGIKEEAHTDGAGANIGNTYVGVYAINVATPYEDSNGTVTRSVQQRTFLGCDSFPVANELSDGDSLVPGAMFLTSFSTGTPGVCLRSFKPDTALITRVAAANEERPERGLLIEATSNNATRISRPQGQDSNNQSRLELGNGPLNADGGLRDVTIKDPLRLEERTEPLIGQTAGQIVYVKNNVNWVVDPDVFDGPGLYTLIQRASGDTDWIKVVSNTK